MELTCFTQRLGQSQGRVVDAGGARFVLGDLTAGWRADLQVGAYVEMTQQVDVTDAKWVRARMSLRVPADLPSALAWEVSLVVDGRGAAAVRGWRGRERMLVDLAANVSKLSGVHLVGLRLTLVASEP
ncbi:MAG: hypothetical protein IPI49_19845 [Myxococcales bacterium]|nr:hypothetical protein [Myxococcales bacterium]